MPFVDLDARYQWLLLEAVYPTLENNIRTIHNKDVDGELHMTSARSTDYVARNDFHRFFKALNSLLSALESLICPEAAQRLSLGLVSTAAADHGANEVELLYPGLTALRGALKAQMDIAWLEAELGSKCSCDVYESAERAIQNLDNAILLTFRGNMRGNMDTKMLYLPLDDEDLPLIGAAEKLRLSHDKLFGLLVDYIDCQHTQHSAWIHMSGFQRGELELILKSCVDPQRRHIASYRRMNMWTYSAYLGTLIIAVGVHLLSAYFLATSETSRLFRDGPKATRGACSQLTMSVTSRVSRQPPIQATADPRFKCQDLRLGAPAQPSQMAYNEQALWPDPGAAAAAARRLAPEVDAGTDVSLRKMLTAGGLQDPVSGLVAHEFEREDQKLVELLLAYSLLFLRDTSWFNPSQPPADADGERPTWMDEMVCFPNPSSDSALDRWRIHLPCRLQKGSAPAPASDQFEQVVYSFGILLLEMETGLKASSLLVEPEFGKPRGVLGNHMVLEAMLMEWARKVDDGYLRVAGACLNFDKCADAMKRFVRDQQSAKLQGLDHQGLHRAAAILGHIVMPLKRLLRDRYPKAFELFSSFGVQVQAPVEDEFEFFDDVPHQPGSKEANDLIKRAKTFQDRIKPCVDDVRDIYRSCPTPKTCSKNGGPIKIAIIDTGIDTKDVFFRDFIESGRIVECRGFVGEATDVDDIVGHGSHVARILMEAAPCAEFYIAKVSDTLKIPERQLDQVAKAIRWAAGEDVDVDGPSLHKRKSVDIISLSFGWHDRAPIIDLALDRAQRAGAHIFAAASNGGASRGGLQAYPARNRSVFCINACDGIGNYSPCNPVATEGNRFMTLGVAVESEFKAEKAYKTGTSFATPMAVALVANTLEFARHRCVDDPVSADANQFFRMPDGVSLLMNFLSTPAQNDYSFVDVSQIWGPLNKPPRSEIARGFNDAHKSSVRRQRAS